jgi:hypothetical protein
VIDLRGPLGALHFEPTLQALWDAHNGLTLWDVRPPRKE